MPRVLFVTASQLNCSITRSRPFLPIHVPFSFDFRIINEFQKEIITQSQTLTSQTAGFTEEIVNRWSAKSFPSITILLNSATTVTSISIVMWDNTITVLDTYSASDVIVIDGVNKTVKINSVEVDYTWTFPVLEVWVNSYTITLDWTYNFDLTATYFNNFI